MKKSISVLFAIFILIVISFTCLIFFGRNKKFDPNINLAAEYLINHTDQNGRFDYIVNAQTGENPKPEKYSSTRHAGTLYAMYIYGRNMKSKDLDDVRYQASKYYINRYIKPLTKNLYAAVSYPGEEKVTEVTAKLGSSGLALAALSNYAKHDKVDIEMLKGLGNFIIFMQKPDGSFYSNFKTESVTKDGKFQSLYYPGEAALGLLYLNEANPSEKWVAASKKALLHIAEVRKNKSLNAPFDHWWAIATKKLFETKYNTLTKEEKELLINNAEQLAKSAVLRQNLNPKDKFYGTIGAEIRPCSIATYMEGLNALYYIVKDKNLKKRIKISIEAGNTYISRCQIEGGITAGGIPVSPFGKTKHAPDRLKLIRIDNIQHAISAWVLFSMMK